MTERERLIDMIDKALDKHESTIENYVHPEQEWIADYLLTNGVIVRPCKVGDTLFFADAIFGEVLKAKVIVIEINYFTEPQLWLTIEYNSPYTGTQEYKSRIDLMIGKTVFLTKEEAEKALKERERK